MYTNCKSRRRDCALDLIPKFFKKGRTWCCWKFQEGFNIIEFIVFLIFCQQAFVKITRWGRVCIYQCMDGREKDQKYVLWTQQNNDLFLYTHRNKPKLKIQAYGRIYLNSLLGVLNLDLVGGIVLNRYRLRLWCLIKWNIYQFGYQ